MSWTDRIAVEEIVKLRDELSIKTFVETGTFRGINAELYAHYFDEVVTCEVERKHFIEAASRLDRYRNVKLYLSPSAPFLCAFKDKYSSRNREDTVFLYLDAHFYDPKGKNKWVVTEELRALESFPNCVIAIHDFNCEGLGHLFYGGEHLGWNVVGEHITRINPDFFYYTNTREWCDIYNEETIKELPITIDEYIIDGIRYANTSDEKRYRGILYATPRKLDLNKFRLKEFQGEKENGVKKKR